MTEKCGLLNCFHKAFESDLRDEKFSDIFDKSHLEKFVCSAQNQALNSLDTSEPQEIPSPTAWKVVQQYVVDQLGYVTSEADEAIAAEQLAQASAKHRNLIHEYKESNWFEKKRMRLTTNIDDYLNAESNYWSTENEWRYAYSLSKLAVSTMDRHHIDYIDSVELESAKLFAVHLFKHAWDRRARTISLGEFATHIYGLNAEKIRSCHQHAHETWE